MRKTLETTRWDAADHLDSEEMVLAYLDAAFEDGHPDLIAAALSNVARARGIADSALMGTASIDRLVAAERLRTEVEGETGAKKLRKWRQFASRDSSDCDGAGN